MYAPAYISSLMAKPDVYKVGRLAAHSDHVCLDFAGNPLPRLSLCGEWGFEQYSSVGALCAAIASGGTLSGTVYVPGHLQLQGHGVPQYLNTQYPWDGRERITPPSLPAENPLSLYARDFELPGAFSGKPVRIFIGGAEPCCAVYCNGCFAGYAEDSFTPSEFDLTPYIIPGKNRLYIAVPRFCTGSWLEDQDFWRFSGLFREVYLYAAEAVHIEDIDLRPELTDDFSSGLVRAIIKLSSRISSSVSASLNAAGTESEKEFELMPGEQMLELELAVPAPRLWSAEDPNLYELDFRIKSQTGAYLCGTRQRFGFRRFELKNGLMLLNGKRIVFRGVNRHEWSCRTGRAISDDEIEWDIKTIKRNNFNAVRCSHYPNASRFYELCDKYGLYVIDETNLETHGTWMALGREYSSERALPGDLPEWRGAVLDRGRSMLERDKNHPCILMWSCGNESRGGSTLYALSEWFRRRDSSRLVHYEGIFHDRSCPDTSDIESRMYAKPDEVRKYLASSPEKPYISCEYAHSMGNSFGNVDEYTALEDEFPKYQGGFVWDFIDQALLTEDENGAPYLAAGGDFGDRPNDGFFCGDGLVFADRTPSPKLEEAKFLFSPVVIACSADGISVRNKNLFVSTAALRFEYVLAADGAELQRGSFTLDVPPGETRAYPLELAFPNVGGELILTCSARLSEAAPWAEAGYEIAFGQAVLRPPLPRRRESVPAALINGSVNIGAEIGGTHALISKATGELYSLCRDGAEYLETPLRADFWRAPTDNDKGCGADNIWAKWKTASLYRRLVSLEADAGQGSVTAHYSAPCMPEITYSIEYRFTQAGRIFVTLRLDPAAGTAPCAGLVLGMPKRFSRLVWYGNTQREAYADRQNGLRLGLGADAASNRLTPYLHTQECGNLTALRTLTVGDKDGRGLRFSSSLPFQGSVLPYTSHELECAGERRFLPPQRRTAVCLRGGMSGVGGDDSWGAPIHPQYLLSTAHGLSYTFEIEIL
jgi:beta-galactosidase